MGNCALLFLSTWYTSKSFAEAVMSHAAIHSGFPYGPSSEVALHAHWCSSDTCSKPSAKVLMPGEEMPILNDLGGVYTR
jgi:hypothetical protein